MNWLLIGLLALLLLLGASILKRRSAALTVASAPRRWRSPAALLTTGPRELNDDESWHITGIRTAEEFFRAVPSLLPEATIMYLEGSPTPDVVEILRMYIEQAEYGGPIGTTGSWPQKNERYSLRVSPQLFGRLADSGSRHAEPEICDHFHFYRLDEPLANWFDAFYDPFVVSKSIPRARVEKFCAMLGVTFTDGAV